MTERRETKTHESGNLTNKLVEDQERLGLTVTVGSIRLRVLNDLIPHRPSRDGEPSDEIEEQRRLDLGRLLGHEVLQTGEVDVEDGLLVLLGGRRRRRGRLILEESSSDEDGSLTAGFSDLSGLSLPRGLVKFSENLDGFRSIRDKHGVLGLADSVDEDSGGFGREVEFGGTGVEDDFEEREDESEDERVGGLFLDEGLDDVEDSVLEVNGLSLSIWRVGRRREGSQIERLAKDENRTKDASNSPFFPFFPMT